VEGCKSLLNVTVKVVEDKIDDESILKEWVQWSCVQTMSRLSPNSRIRIHAQERRKANIPRYQELWKKHQVFTCLICQCEESLEDAPSRPPTPNCKHDPSVCSDCMSGFLSNAIGKGGWQEIRCPDSSCVQILSGGDVQAFASREAFLK
jgi:hypothetical protein